jgi:SNF2-related domain
VGRRIYEQRPYAALAFDHLVKNPRCALWARPGLGKTIITLNYIQSLLAAGEVKHVLVLGPMRVAQSVWTEEAARWQHLEGLSVVSAVGTPTERKAALAQRAQVTCINYENLPWLIDTLGDDWFFDAVVADESTKLKSFRLRQGGKRSAALAQHAHKTVRYWINLTGTPSPNGLVDLWGQNWFIDAGQRLGRSFSAFQDRYFMRAPGSRGNFPGPMILQPHADELIHAAVSDVCLGIDPRDYFDMREPVYTDIVVKLPSAARATYRTFEREMFVELQAGEAIEAVAAAAKSIKCLQLANGAAYIGDDASAWQAVHDVKLDALADLSEELDEPLLVAYHFRADRERLLARFPKALDLGTTDGMRRAKAGEGRLWLGHPAGMGHGVDGLQAHCRAICFFGHWWDAEHYEQIIERVGPMRQLQAGHERNVLIYSIIAESTIDEVVTARRTSKLSVQDSLLAYMKGKA